MRIILILLISYNTLFAVYVQTGEPMRVITNSLGDTIEFSYKTTSGGYNFYFSRTWEKYGVKYRYTETTYREEEVCPSEQPYEDKNTSICEPKPDCSQTPETPVYDSETNECKPKPEEPASDPNGDHDNDTVPNKCDTDHPDYDNLSCNDNPIPNKDDPDIDGDGVPNGADLDNTTVPTDEYDDDCKGVNRTNPIFYGTVYATTSYTYKGFYSAGTCEFLKSNTQGVNATFEYKDENPLCTRTYCYLHYEDESANSMCNYNYDYLRPTGYIYDGSIKNETECSAKVDGANYNRYKWEYPDSINCPNHKFCYLRPLKADVEDVNPDNPDSDMGNDNGTNTNDTNSTNQNLADSNITINTKPLENILTNDIKPLIETTNTKLNKLDELANIKDEAVKSNSKLDSIKTHIMTIKPSIDSVNSSTLSVKSGIDESNSKLTSIDDTLKKISEKIDDIDTNSSSTAISSSDNNDNNISYSEDLTQKENREKVDNVLTDVYSSLSDIKNDYEDMKSTLERGLDPINLSSGTEPIFCTTVFSKNICVNLCDSFGVFRDIFYYIFTTVFLLVSLKLYYTAFKMR